MKQSSVDYYLIKVVLVWYRVPESLTCWGCGTRWSRTSSGVRCVMQGQNRYPHASKPTWWTA